MEKAQRRARKKTHEAAAEEAPEAALDPALLAELAALPPVELAPGVVRGVLSPPAVVEAPPAAAEVAPPADSEAATTEASDPSTATSLQEEDPGRTVTWSA